MSEKIRYTEEPLGNLRVIPDFLPPPEDLVFRDATLTVVRQCRIFRGVHTVIETPTFSRLAADYWTEEERSTFASYIATNPEAGDVVPGSGGVRKVRWSYPSRGKRGGVRVIYFNRLTRGEIWVLLIYGKSARENISSHVLRRIKEEIENA